MREAVDENLVRLLYFKLNSLMARKAHSRTSSNKRSRYLWLLTLAVACALAASVATRASVPSLSHGVSAGEQSSSAMRQHMDRDGMQWGPPVVTAVIATVVCCFYPRFAPAGPPLPNTLFDNSLYNRPPPAR